MLFALYVPLETKYGGPMNEYVRIIAVLVYLCAVCGLSLIWAKNNPTKGE